MTIGQRIAQKRKELGLSQEALGAELGVSRQSIYKWESDSALPEIDKLIALSRRFAVSVGWLLGVEESPVPESGEHAEPAPSGELNETQLRMVEEIVERYAAAQPKPPAPRRRKLLALAAAGLLTEGHQLPGSAPARLDGVDAEGVDHAHLVPLRRQGPGDGVVLRQLDRVQVDHAPEKAVFLTNVQGAGLQGLPGGVGCGVFAPLPVGVDWAGGRLPGEDGVVDRGDPGQVPGSGKSDHGKAPIEKRF